MPTCEQCHNEIPPGAVTCPVCEEQAAQLGEHAYQDFLNYDGEDYLIRAFLEDGQSEDEARREVQDPSFLRMCLEFGGLEHLLKDRWATKGLVTALVNRDAGVVASLNAYVSHRIDFPVTEVPVPVKPGPKPDTVSGKYKYEIAVELKDKGYTLAQIALELYGDSKLANRVAALLSARRTRPQQ